jgi:hypothetical protein
MRSGLDVIFREAEQRFLLLFPEKEVATLLFGFL